jgi:hypothetical protein
MNLNIFISIPTDDEDREGPPKSRYISKKDLRWIIVGAIVLFIFGYPLFSNFKEGRDWHICASNMNGVYKALSSYANDYDGRFPPVAEEADPHTGAPGLYDGRLRTWVTQAFRYDNDPAIYNCPKAQDSETFPNEGDVRDKATGKVTVQTVRSSYGMYRGYNAAMLSAIERPGQVVFLTETSNFGAETSYDPLPFLDQRKATVPFDGFSVGWDTNNIQPDPTSKKLTRLAFRQSSKGDFSQAFGRHQSGIHAITADGNLLVLKPGDATLHLRAGDPTGEWAVPASIGH